LWFDVWFMGSPAAAANMVIEGESPLAVGEAWWVLYAVGKAEG
jgi:hypothetical protein